jgi:hypothetical protein
MKRHRSVGLIAAILAILAFLLGVTTRALWIEREHHNSGHMTVTSPASDASNRPPEPVDITSDRD